jgi:hypothetical protein
LAKKAVLPLGLFTVVMILLAIYLAKTQSNAESRDVAVTAEAEAIADPAEAVEPAPAEPAPVQVTPAAATAPEPVHTAPAAATAPTPPSPPAPRPIVTPIEPSVTPIDEAPAAEAVEPGSPASRFLAAEPAQPTIAAGAKSAFVPNTDTLGAESRAEPVAKAKSARGKSARQLRAEKRAEKRAAAKRAAKASIAASKARAKARAAAAEEEEVEEGDEAPAPKPPANGKGTLQIASTPPMEVWVDGRNSNAQTPVRIILRAGKHKVTLFDKQTAKARSFEVDIKADETTKIVKKY